MADRDLVSLYSGRLLELASDIPMVGRLEAPDASVRKRSPQCGSAVTVDLNVRNDVVKAFAQDVKACALGQAAASVLGAVVIGRSHRELADARDALAAMLTSDGPVPAGHFSGFEALLPARDFKNRHASILLAIEATVEAFEAAEKADCA